MLRLRLAVDGLLLRLRSDVDGLRELVLPLRARFVVDGLVLGVDTPRSLDCAPEARLPVLVDVRPRAWSRVTRLDPELAPYLFATLEFP